MGKSYNELSERQKKNSLKAGLKYKKEKTTRFTIQYTNTDFEVVREYMNACGVNRYNSFVKECVKYAIDNDFKGIKNTDA